MTGARYGRLAPPSATQPGPYSEHAVAALLASRDARIRELESDLARLREVEAAALAFLGKVDSKVDGKDTDSHKMYHCDTCGRVATTWSADRKVGCDDHPVGNLNFDYAPAWRRLLKAVGR